MVLTPQICIAETSHFYTSESSPPAYLSDSRGRSVTPIISPPVPIRPLPASQQQPADGDAGIVGSAPPQPAAKQRGRPPKHGGVAKAAPSAHRGVEHDPDLKRLAQHQRLVGPLMDRMGCVLASDERRTTFLDDEDFEDEVRGSDHDMRE